FAAWTGPTATAPGNNVLAPINVGATDQTKNSNLGVNGLAVFGNSILQANSYLNWGATSGTNGYGVRDNGGTLEFKNTGGSWQSLQTIINNYVPLGGGGWALSSNNLYNTNSANVSVGAGTNPGAKLTVSSTGSDISGTAMSTTFRTQAGNLGTTAGNELTL